MIKPEATALKAQPSSPPLVYVVDDEAMLLELAKVILEPLGYELCTFRDPQSAVTQFARAHPRPDLVITDYAMHQMNGMELIQECRRMEPNQKILLVSGTVGAEIFEGAPARPDQFLAKPYYARQLIDLVKGLLAT
ncbi:MAG TPA: response regulator [Verrucomicrobiae bacterium]|nr:response regulator [Verrucomicrobiae bacterium]